jgi:uncharacterized protein (DUF2235 family)
VEDKWITRYSQPIDIKFVGIWDTVGALGIPFAAANPFNVARYQFLETHLRLTNTFAFHALAVDEHRALFEPTLWTKTVAHDAGESPHQRTLNQVEQRWFVGAHANVGGGYPNDILAQAPLKWLMEKAAQQGLKFKSEITLDTFDSEITDSYADFAFGLYRRVSRRYFRPIGKAPDVGTRFTTSTINETIDAGVFERWRKDPTYRPKNVAEWAQRVNAIPDDIRNAVMANDPSAVIV